MNFCIIRCCSFRVITPDDMLFNPVHMHPFRHPWCACRLLKVKIWSFTLSWVDSLHSIVLTAIFHQVQHQNWCFSEFPFSSYRFNFVISRITEVDSLCFENSSETIFFLLLVECWDNLWVTRRLGIGNGLLGFSFQRPYWMGIDQGDWGIFHACPQDDFLTVRSSSKQVVVVGPLIKGASRRNSKCMKTLTLIGSCGSS